MEGLGPRVFSILDLVSQGVGIVFLVLKPLGLKVS